MAKKTKPIKTDLFKFVTLRTPQLIDEQKRDIGFIFHNNTAKSTSKFLETVVEDTTLNDSRTIVKTAVQQFVPIKSYLEVKSINTKMYNFSSWLMNNRNLVFKTESDEKLAEVQTPSLTNEQQNKLWDNLYYQVLTRKSSYVRQACIQMLVAHNYLAKNGLYNASNHQFTEEEYLVKLANAKVVIDKAFTKSKTHRTKNRSLNKKTLKNLKNIATKYFAQKELNNYKKAQKDLFTLEKLYKEDFNEALQLENTTYETTIKPLVKTAKDEQKVKQIAEDEKAITENREPKIIPTELELPKFDFQFEKHFSKNYFSKLTDNTKNILEKHSIIEDTKNSFEDVYKTLNEETKKFNQLIYKGTPTSRKKIIIDGNVIETKVSGLDPNCFNVYGKGQTNTGSGDGGTDPIIIDNGCQRIMTDGFVNLTINLGNSLIVSESHAVNINSNTTNSLHSDIMSTNNNEVTLNLFPAANLVFTGSSSITLSGSFTLSNNDQINYNIQLNVTSNLVFGTGCGTLIPFDSGDSSTGNGDSTTGDNSSTTGDDNSTNDGSETTTTTTTNNNTNTSTTKPSFEKLYGVGKIGIADFRKVEQEVCCYVAGEVSHIENILAREYKKRETRNLLVSESTIEKTSEKEIENLTDTSTTERNELQSEISSVLNEDKSQAFGASAGVSGSYGKINFSADAYADFANSSSSSQSNSDAQTYAKEITERTLERIVQKTSTKRTSRILKEFEEKNEHGFDNREGTEHVSGVYRWIDIIYKNQLVNYGKRMMYEFMVPEPSRFFKEAIKPNGDDNNESCNNILVLEKPIHPSELTNNILAIDDATDLDENNYLQLSSIYNAEVNPMPKNNIYISKAFSIDNRERNAIGRKETVVVPKNYETISFKINGNKTKSDGTGRHVITIANKEVSGINGSFSNHNYSITIDKIVDELEIAIAVDRYWSFAVGISIKCQRTSEALQQWQNETYKAIIDAYNEQLQSYYDAKKEACVNKQIEEASNEKEDIRFSNSFNRTIEKREIKRICIEMLALPHGNPMGKDNYNDYDPEIGELPVVNKNPAFENHAAHVKFFEQAFDWEIMAYLFYPYYWAQDSDWKELYKQSSASDPIFQAFLQSGMSRAVVPVRPGFEDAVNYYIETGDIWNGGDLVIDQENDLYLSIASEMQNVEGEVEKTWETRMPTALTMIQKDTVGLEETGLPCCGFVLGEDDEPEFDNSIMPQQNSLGVVLETQDTSVIDSLSAAIEIIKAKLELDEDSIGKLNTEIDKVESKIVENIIIDNDGKFLELTTTKNEVVAKIAITSIKDALDIQ